MAELRTIWNPWHGCRRVSPGCDNCYMFQMDEWRGLDGSVIRRLSDTSFNYPLSKNRQKQFKVPSGTLMMVGLTTDFFLRQADEWRPEAWNIIRQRPDVMFHIITKRPHRVEKCLPPDWVDDGWNNVIINVTTENQKYADLRLPIVNTLPVRHLRVSCTPMLGPIEMQEFLEVGKIEKVYAGGENYNGARPLRAEWVERLREQCVAANVSLDFFDTGTILFKGDKAYKFTEKQRRHQQAVKSGYSFTSTNEREWLLVDPISGWPIEHHDADVAIDEA